MENVETQLAMALPFYRNFRPAILMMSELVFSKPDTEKKSRDGTQAGFPGYKSFSWWVNLWSRRLKVRMSRLAESRSASQEISHDHRETSREGL